MVDRKPLSEEMRKAKEAGAKCEAAQHYFVAGVASLIAEKLWIAERGSLPGDIYPLSGDGRGLDEPTRKFCWWCAKNIPVEVVNLAVQATQDACMSNRAGEREKVAVWPYFRGTLSAMCKERGINGPASRADEKTPPVGDRGKGVQLGGLLPREKGMGEDEAW